MTIEDIRWVTRYEVKTKISDSPPFVYERRVPVQILEVFKDDRWQDVPPCSTKATISLHEFTPIVAHR